MKKNIILTICIFLILITIVIDPKTYIEVSAKAIDVWAKILVPSLLPFFIFTKFLTNLNQVQSMSKLFAPVTKKVYKVPAISSYIFLMSIITGYPVGSKLTADLVANNQLSKTDAKKCITFTSNSGPMFIVGSVGIGMLMGAKYGYIILISHIIGAILNGLIYRNVKSNKNDKPYEITPETNPKTENFLSKSVLDSISSILLVGGIIVIMFIIIEILTNIGFFNPLVSILQAFGIKKTIATGITSGVFEITKGCLAIASANVSMFLKTILCSMIISFGGFSTILQSMAFLNKIVSYKFFILQKITHSIFATIVSVILCLIFGI